MEAFPMAEETRVIPRRKPEAVYRVIEGQAMIAVAGRSQVHLLNEVGTFIITLIDGVRGTDEIVRRVTEEFEVTETQARADVAAFLTQLTDQGVLE